MNATKVIALLLGMASLALLMFFGFVSFAGPSLLGQSTPAPWPLDQLSSGCLGLVLFCAAAPLAVVPGLAGLGLWLFVIRKHDAVADWEAMAGPEREAAFQNRLDGLTRRLLDHGGDSSVLAPEIPIWTRDLADSQKNRLLHLLAECSGDGQRWRDGLAPVASDQTASGPLWWWTRALSLGLLGCAAFCFLWGAFVAFSYLTSDLGKMVGLGSAPADAAAGSGGCFVIGLAALLAGLAVRWLVRREASRGQRLAASSQRARDIALEGCTHRIEGLLKEAEADAPAAAPQAALRIARAHVICTLPELDGVSKGRLVAWLHARGLLSKLALSGADPRGAALAETDLSATSLAGLDLSGATLSGARLVQVDQRRGRNQGGAMMTPANRNVWLEVAACALFLCSLVLFLVASYHTAMFIVSGLLPGEPPLTVHGVVFGHREALVAALSTGLPGAALIAAAWGLRSLLVEEGAAYE